MRGLNYCWLGLLTVLLLASEPAATGYSDGQAVGFALYGNYLMVGQGSAGPLKGLNFILDSGASPTVLDRQVAQKLHLEERPANIAVLNGDVTAGQAIVPNMRFGPIQRNNFSVLIEDLSFVQKALPVHIDAVVGLDLLGQRAFEIDYTSREVRFGQVPPLATSLPVHIRGGLPIVDAEVDHFSVHLLVDTGTPSLIIFKERASRLVSSVKIGSDQPPAGRRGVLDRDPVRLRSLRIGEVEFGRRPAYLVPGRIDGVQDDFDGLIGPAALGITKIAVDLGRGRLEFSR